jgi:RND family efflux transporter MFP subunit
MNWSAGLRPGTFLNLAGSEPGRRPALHLSLAVALATILSGCGSKHEGASDAAPNLPTAQVTTQKAESKSRAMTEEVVATVRAKLHATLEAKLNGRIELLPVVLGDTVRKGQLIAKLDAGEIAARLEQADASLDQAERDWKRISGLFDQHGVTQSEYDSSQARLRTAKGAVAEAKAMMSYVEVLAPFDGVVTKKWADVGDLAVPGKPLVEIEDPSALQLDADIPEAISGRVQRGAQLTVRAGNPSADLTGMVSEIAPAADPASRTLRVKLDLPKTDGLKSGQFARLIVPIGESNSLRVPASAVVRRGQLEIVFVAESKQARMHLVKTGKRLGDEIEILSGLDSGDAVIVSDVAQLTDGQPVEVK